MQNKIQASARPGRVISIDLFRGFFLCVMVFDHFLLYYGNEEAMDNWFYCLINDGIAGWGAGAFLMMMGASQALSANRQNTDNFTLFKKALVRGTYLFAVGLLMLLLSFGPSDIWRWDILTLIGTSTVLLFFCRFLSTRIILAAVALIVILTPVLRSLPMMDFYWEMIFQETPVLRDILPGLYWDPTAEPEFHWQLGHIVKGFFFWGEFAIFPWLIFSLLGFVVGRRIVAGKFKSDVPKVVAAGLVLFSLGFSGAILARSKPPVSAVGDFISPLCFYPDSFTMILYQIGINVVVFTLLFHYFDVLKKDSYKPGIIAHFFKRTSNFSLTYYFLHYMLVGWPLLMVYAVTGEDRTMDLMGFWPSFLCGLGAFSFLQWIIYNWEKKESRYSLEWGMAKLVAKVVKDYKRKV